MALNEPRFIPYEFRVFEFDGLVWLYDASERTYPCTATPHIYAEPLYCNMPEHAESGCDCSAFGEGALFQERDVDAFKSFAVCTIAASVPEREAWDDAREDANGNCRI